RPARLARAHVERLNVSRRLRSGLRRVGHLRSQHDDVATHLGAAARLVGCRARTEARLQVHAPGRAPRADGGAGARIERDQVFTPDDKQAALVSVGPERERTRAVATEALRRLVGRWPLNPEGLSRAWMECLDQSDAIRAV